MPKRRIDTSALLLILLGLSLWGAFQLMAPAQGGYSLGLGNLGFPSYRFVAFTMFYGLLGGAGAVFIAVGVSRGFSPLSFADTRWFVFAATGLGIVIPAVIRWSVLSGGVVADDEAVYRFSAALLASGRLTAPSHPLKLFFDHAFIVNDGRMYSQYFLGWPAIMAAGIPFGATGYVNSLVSGATVPALYKLLKDVVGVTWARVGVVVFLTSPMIQIAAATEMSHTSALGALVYAMWLVGVALRGGGPAAHFGFGLALSVAFFVRPASAVAVGLPWGLLWLWTQLRNRSFIKLLWFAIPTTVLGALFLMVNAELTGSIFGVAYQRAFQYGVENGLRFTHVMPLRADATVMMTSGGLAEMIRMASIGILRLNMSLFGWPLSLGLMPLAIGLRPANWWWASVAVYVATHLWLFDAGIDTFGPTHWFELALPILVLTMLGCERATGWGAQVSSDAASLPRNLVFSFVAASLLLFTPYRLRAVSEIGEMTRRAPDALEQSGTRNAVIFVNRPWGDMCYSGGLGVPKHFVFWWPVNDPDFEDDIIWANHLSVEQDRKLLAAFPGRQGYVMWWGEKPCKLELIPIDEAARRGIPNGNMGTELYTDDHPPTGERPN